MNDQKKAERDLIFETVFKDFDDFHTRLDAECKKVISEAGINGKITKAKLTRLGYTIVYTPDHSARICKNGVVVSEIIYRKEL